MKKFRFLLLAYLLCLTIGANAYDFSAENADGVRIDYNILSSTDLTCEMGCPTHNYYDVVNIPASVSYNNKTYSVISIADGAFDNRSVNLISVTIPISVTNIGNKAFRGCNGLTSMKIPNSVINIGNYAFAGCSGLISLTIGNSVISIGSRAFSGCSGLTSITIPNSVTSIGDGAFADCRGLTYVIIPNFVTSIGWCAFEGCSGLTSIEIPNSVKNIEDYAFRNCSGLTSIEIPNSVTSIGSCAFAYCTGLTFVTIPNSVTSIGESAFVGCKGLTSVTIPNSVTSIGVYAFYDCDLTSVVVESGNKYYDSRENCNAIIETATNTLIQGSKTTIIPNSVTGIGRSAFSYCSGLESVDIPIDVTNIGESAFSYCTGLKSVKVHWKRPLSIDGSTFSGVDNSKCTLYVPKGTEMLYWVTEGWSSFKNIVEYDEPEDVSYYITINGLEGGEIMQKVDIGMTYSYKFKPYEEWEINSVTFNGVDVTSQLQDSIFSTPAIAGNSALSVVYKKVSSAIDAVEGNDDVRILATSGAIVINGAKAGKAVSVYGLNGNMVESTKTNGASTIVSLPQKGVYIVKVGNDVFKVSI